MPHTILVVDDETDLELLITQKFRKNIRQNEYSFLFAHNGVEALQAISAHPEICLVLSDINMPEMDGLTLLQKILELKHVLLRTVIVSAYGDMENIRTAMNRGAFDFVTKPIDFSDLEITIKRTIEQIESQRMSLKEHDQLLTLQQDLSAAREIQQFILPKVFPPFPQLDTFDVYGTMKAARDVGGDFFDFFLIGDDRLGFVIADVAGKGMAAALFMAVSRTLIRAVAQAGDPPQIVMARVNDLLCKESIDCMFVTALYGILNIRNGAVEYTNAGHNPPYVISAGGDTSRITTAADPALGVFGGISYHAHTLQLAAQDLLLLFTDGVTEAMDQDQKLFGEERLASLLAQLKGAGVEGTVKAVLGDVGVFGNGAEQSDDITLMALQYGVKPASAPSF